MPQIVVKLDKKILKFALNDEINLTYILEKPCNNTSNNNIMFIRRK